MDINWGYGDIDQGYVPQVTPPQIIDEHGVRYVEGPAYANRAETALFNEQAKEIKQYGSSSFWPGLRYHARQLGQTVQEIAGGIWNAGASAVNYVGGPWNAALIGYALYQSGALGAGMGAARRGFGFTKAAASAASAKTKSLAQQIASNQKIQNAINKAGEFLGMRQAQQQVADVAVNAPAGAGVLGNMVAQANQNLGIREQAAAAIAPVGRVLRSQVGRIPDFQHVELPARGARAARAIAQAAPPLAAGLNPGAVVEGPPPVPRAPPPPPPVQNQPVAAGPGDGPIEIQPPYDVRPVGYVNGIVQYARDAGGELAQGASGVWQQLVGTGKTAPLLIYAQLQANQSKERFRNAYQNIMQRRLAVEEQRFQLDIRNMLLNQYNTMQKNQKRTLTSNLNRGIANEQSHRQLQQMVAERQRIQTLVNQTQQLQYAKRRQDIINRKRDQFHRRNYYQQQNTKK